MIYIPKSAAELGISAKHYAKMENGIKIENDMIASGEIHITSDNAGKILKLEFKQTDTDFRSPVNPIKTRISVTSTSVSFSNSDLKTLALVLAAGSATVWLVAELAA